MKKLKQVAAVGLTLALTVGTVNLTGFMADASGLPTTVGHTKYVNSSVFDVIGSDTFGSTDLASPLFDKTKGSSNITNLQVPTLAYNDTSIGLVWEKPEKYDNVADYNVYINGIKQETARENFKKNADWTAKYMESFYNYYASNTDINTVNVDVHSFRATNLKPDTTYTFDVVAIDSTGKELGTAQEIKQKTTTSQQVFNITDYGAKTSEGYTTYDDAINSFIVSNTKAIQAAIDACTPGGKVVVPEGTFVSGALWLKSDITLEIDGTLWASPNSDHFEIGFLMYPFYTDTRDWGLINAISADDSTPLTNIRVTGTGTIYGNGWKYGSGDSIKADGYTYSESADVDTTVAANAGYALPRWVSGNNKKVYNYGVQAADSCRKWLSNLTNADGSRKYTDDVISSLQTKIAANNGDALTAIDGDDLTDAYATRASLVIMRNVTNVYIGDVTVENPANHSVNILDSRNISANNVKVFSYDGNNGDGLGFGCSQNVICWNNFTDTGDDNLGFGASVGEGARDCDIQTNSEIWMFDNYLHEGHGGLAAGSHTGNGIQDVLFEDTVMNHIDMGFRFKSAPTNGGFIANITMRDCALADTNQGYVLTTNYSDPNSASSSEGAEIGEFYNFASYNVSVYGTAYNNICVYADVDPENVTNKPWHNHHNLYFQDITFANVGTAKKWDVKNSYSGWDSLTGCTNAVFYNVTTKSYSSSVASGYNKAWTNIKYCNNIRFQGTTTTSLGANTTLMTAAETLPVWAADATLTATSAADGQSANLTWGTATDTADAIHYGVETYIGSTMVDTVSGLTSNNTTISGLSSGVDYTFKVFATDANGNNKTYGPNKAITTTGAKDTTAIIAPAMTAVTTADPLYTATQITWAAAGRTGKAVTSSGTNKTRSGVTVTDARIRGYKILVNGKLYETDYNYQLNGGVVKSGTGITGYNRVTGLTEQYSVQVGRLTPGANNTIQVIAFTDSGVEYSYDPVVVRTLDNYDYQAPVFAADAQVLATAQSNGDVVLKWSAAKDDTAVNGYRVYVDGTPVLGSDKKTFNPVNGAKTTADTSYTVSGLDLTKSHTFTIQAGDAWWKAAKTMGTFDKMADYNWTIKGISTVLKEKSTEPTTEPTTQPATQPTTQPATQPTTQATTQPTTSQGFSTTNTVADSVTGQKLVVSAQAADGVLPLNSVFAVTMITSGSAYDNAAALFSNGLKLKLLNLHVNDGSGTEIEPNGQVKVTLDLPQGFQSGSVKVYRVNADRSLTDMNATCVNGKLIFTTDHFSEYAVVETIATTTITTTATENTTVTNSTAAITATETKASSDNAKASVSTGDNNKAWLYATAMGIALLGVCCLTAKRKKER